VKHTAVEIICAKLYLGLTKEKSCDTHSAGR
jgi:hypothetical protein